MTILASIASHFPAPLSYAVYLHAFAGSVALLTFLIPLLVAKGGRAHVRAGWVYVGAMIAVSLATFLITPWRYFADPTCTERSRGFAVFLSFIALFALTALQQGLIVLRHKRRDARLITAATVALPAALTLAALALAAWGFARGTWLYVIFAALGAKTGVEQLAFWARKPVGPRPWLRCHLENFFVACIATVTAFLVTAAPRLFPGAEFDSIWVWLAPTFVLVPWQVYFKRRLAL